jgi:hypothetical protein
MNAEKPSLAVALKTLWGASQMPFGEACAEPFRHPSFKELNRHLQQLCDIGASGLLHGANGVGKSYLCGCFTEKLPEKRFKVISLASRFADGQRSDTQSIGTWSHGSALLWPLVGSSLSNRVIMSLRGFRAVGVLGDSKARGSFI